MQRFKQAISGCLLAGLAVWTVPASGAAPQVRTQAPGFYRMMLGDIEVTALSDGTHPFPVDTVMAHVSAPAIARDLARAGLSAPVQGAINAFLLNTGTQLILIDTGAGALYGDCCGKLLANLRAAGYRPEQVDQVFLTHMHKDHVGGILEGSAMAFPHAVLRVNQADAAYWLSAASRTRRRRSCARSSTARWRRPRHISPPGDSRASPIMPNWRPASWPPPHAATPRDIRHSPSPAADRRCWHGATLSTSPRSSCQSRAPPSHTTPMAQRPRPPAARCWTARRGSTC